MSEGAGERRGVGGGATAYRCYDCDLDYSIQQLVRYAGAILCRPCAFDRLDNQVEVFGEKTTAALRGPEPLKDYLRREGARRRQVRRERLRSSRARKVEPRDASA